ncbi:hypothetical protein GJ496_004865, partial [Pomphorhynchus laevis]
MFATAFLTIPVSTFLLGNWQLRRMKWKSALIAQVSNKMTSDPIPIQTLNELLEYDRKNDEYTKVSARGRYLHEKEILLFPRYLINAGEDDQINLRSFDNVNSKFGVHVITPFQLESDKYSVILVDRGFVPWRYKRPDDRKAGQVEGACDIVGVLRNDERKTFGISLKDNIDMLLWKRRDISQMSKALDTAPVFLDLVSDCSTVKKHCPIPYQTRIDFPDDHLQYAITWYCTALLTSIL